MYCKNIKFILVIFCLAFAVSFSFANTFTSVNKKEAFQQKAHTVSKGETMYSIAQKYNITIVELYAANPQVKDGISIGEVLDIPLNVNSSPYANKFSTYTVKPKETLYSIAKEQGVKVDDIIEANPQLKTDPLANGQIILIPSSMKLSRTTASEVPSTLLPTSNFLSHKVLPKETIYGIAKQYNISAEALADFNPDLKDGLKIGTTLIIPILQANSALPTSMPLQNINTPSIGLLLPFINKSDAKTARFIEYYEGFLLALEEMKEKGFSANVYVFDLASETGTAKLKGLLETNEMKYLNLIIGGVSSEQIDIISNFAKKQNINYVVPFPTKTNDARDNAKVFQVNAPFSILYGKVSKTFVNLYPNANIIYIASNGITEDRTDFINELSGQLAATGRNATTVVADQNIVGKLTAALDPNRKNVIVPSSASAKMLQSVLPALKTIVNSQPGMDISLFGHTNWQTYPQYFADFAQFDTYIYTPFYIRENDPRVEIFMANYHKWYNNKSLINTYPKYAILGYDTGLFFFNALNRYGENFVNNVNGMTVATLQTPFIFTKDNPLGGYVNTGFYLVHYNADGTTSKTEYGRW